MFRTIIVAVTLLICTNANAGLTLVSGGRILIDDVSNPSNGMAFLQTSFSVGMTSAAALANAQMTYPSATLATPAQWDDLAAAAGVQYAGAWTLASAFDVGSGINSGAFNAAAPTEDLVALFGETFSSADDGKVALFFSDPDMSTDTTTTRDGISFFDGTGLNQPTRAEGPGIFQSTNEPGVTSFRAWGIVVAVPEPSAFTCLGLIGLVASGRAWWRRRR